MMVLCRDIGCSDAGVDVLFDMFDNTANQLVANPRTVPSDPANQEVTASSHQLPSTNNACWEQGRFGKAEGFSTGRRGHGARIRMRICRGISKERWKR